MLQTPDQRSGHSGAWANPCLSATLDGTSVCSRVNSNTILRFNWICLGGRGGRVLVADERVTEGGGLPWEFWRP